MIPLTPSCRPAEFYASLENHGCGLQESGQSNHPTVSSYLRLVQDEARPAVNGVKLS